MSQRTLANPVVQINGTPIGIMPNTCVVKDGRGDITLRPQSAGGNSIEMIKTVNAETKKGMVKFSLYNSEVNDDLKKDWQDQENGSTIRLSEGTYVKSFRSMYVITDPEVELGADGKIEIIFEGQPAV